MTSRQGILENIKGEDMRTIVLTLLLILAGCSTTGVNYESSSYNVREAESNLERSLAIGEFTREESSEVIDPWTFRGATSIKSPVGNGYQDFIAKAIENELLLARRLDPSSNFELTGKLTAHIVDASSLSLGEGKVAMEFVLKESGNVRYRDTKTIIHKWESAFVGMTAANNAARAHLEMIEKLINSLFQDKAFYQAVNK
jgi:hypothetical protein